MTVTGTDDFGPYTHTGVNTVPAPRPSTEVEAHYANEFDTGSKLTITQLTALHVPHRSATLRR
jgi:hypothetical protein